MVLLGLIADFAKEKEDRKTFKRFYDYRESHTKFRNLMVSGLPTSLLIISRDLKQKLFSNQCLEEILRQELDPKGRNQIEVLHEWLESLKIDYTNMKEGGGQSQSLIFDKELTVSVLGLIKNYKKNEDLLVTIPDQKFTFNAEYHSKVNVKKIYEINTSQLVWDAQDAIAIILNDVTVHSLNQSLKIADSNKDKMLAMISHELRTPLNGILGVVKILRKQTKDSQTLQYLSICKSSGELLYNIVNSILDLQLIRDRKFSLKMIKHDLHQLARDVQNLFRLQFDEKNLYLSLDIAHDVPQYIVTDHNRLRQILINLVGNALKFTFEGGVCISIQRSSEQKGFIEFTIQDTGIGIREEDQAKLFKMYGRIDQKESKINTQGVGFGLEISNQLARLLGDLTKGDSGNEGIKCTSQFGKGTKFSFGIKDHATTSQDIDDIDFYDPQTFEEDIENLSLKLSPYSLHSILSTDRDQSLKSSSPVGVYASKKSSRVALCSPSHLVRRNTKSKTQSRRLSQMAPKSKFQQNNSYDFLKCETPIASSGAFQSKEGTACEVRLLQIPVSNDSPVSDKSHQVSMEMPMAMKSVLVVDDNPFNLLIAKHLVEYLGYQVETALNGKLGVDLVKSLTAAGNKKPFEAILMDLQMPVMDGYEATKVLRKMMVEQEIEEIPIIALSANDSDDDKLRCKEVGMQEHLSKPLKEERLKRIMCRLVEKEGSLMSLYDLDG